MGAYPDGGFISKRSCSHSVNSPRAAMSRESSGGRMAAMSSINETALAPGTGVLALESLVMY